MLRAHRSGFAFVLCVISCTTSATSGTPPSPPARPLDPAQTRVQLEQLDDRFARAAADGLAADECAEALRGYESLVARSSSDAALTFRLATVADACGAHDRATALYRELADRDYAPGLINLGVVAADRGDLDHAIALFERAVAVEPGPAIVARNNLAGALIRRHHTTRARRDFELAERTIQQVLAADSDNDLAYENLARLYLDRGEVEPSYRLLAELVVEQGQRVLARDGRESAELHNLRGLLWLADGDASHAIRSFTHTVELEPDHVDAHRNLALVALRFRGFEQAERSLAAILGDPVAAADVEVWLALGVARRGLGDLDGAAAAYEQAAVVAPADPRPWFDLGVLAQDHRTWHVQGDREWIANNIAAAGYFRAFVDKAGAAPQWQASVVTARDRIAIAEDTIDTIAAMSQLGCRLDESRVDPVEEQARREKLLELERQAAAAQGPTPEITPRPNPAELERRLILEAQAQPAGYTVADDPAPPE